MAKKTETKLTYNLKYSTLEYMTPEFIRNHNSNQDSFKLDVYLFGILIYYLLTGIQPFSSYYNDKEKMKHDILNGKRPEIPKNIPEECEKKMLRCWNQEPEKRLNFSQICRELESHQFVNNRINLRDFIHTKMNFLINRKLKLALIKIQHKGLNKSE